MMLKNENIYLFLIWFHIQKDSEEVAKKIIKDHKESQEKLILSPNSKQSAAAILGKTKIKATYNSRYIYWILLERLKIDFLKTCIKINAYLHNKMRSYM